MSARSDHLIERAAAKLREANAAAVPSIDRPQAPDQRAAPGFEPPAPVLPFQPFVVPQPAQPLLRDGNPATDAGPSAASAPSRAEANPGVEPPLLGPPPASCGPHEAAHSAQAGHASPANPGTLQAGTEARETPAAVELDMLERSGMAVARRTRTRISEEYRIATGRILRTLHESPGSEGARNVLMVTSARPGEGKSFTALNLAGSIAQNGTDPVLLVDVDPKVKPLSDKLGLGDASGFLDLVADPSLRPEDLIRSSAVPNLRILPVGNRDSGSAQASDGVASVHPVVPAILRLARRFPKHLIVLDAPPCLSTSDPHTMAPHVGQIVMVVEAARTQRAEVEAALDLVRVCPSITMLLNKVRLTTSHTFGAYDYFGSYT